MKVESFEVRGSRFGNELGGLPFLKVIESRDKNFFQLNFQFIKDQSLESLWVEFQLTERPIAIRSSYYEWIPIDKPDSIANYHSPKILKFEGGRFLLGLNNEGVWEWDKAKNILKWVLIHPDLTPTFHYNENDEREWLRDFKFFEGKQFETSLFWGNGPVPEFSRTPMGFVATVCFTDHCDFDTPSLLESQRHFFKEVGIRTTKGIFLHTFSHQGDFAALDQAGVKEEFEKWEEDGHELAYHALSRSFREESWEEYAQLESPEGLNRFTTYIDHGFLPYNYTKQEVTGYANWYRHMESAGINLIWNYLDVIEGNLRSNNQLLPTDSTILAIKEEKAVAIRKKVSFDPSRNFKTRLAYGTREGFDKGMKRLNATVKFAKKGNLIPFLKAAVNVLKEGIAPEIWVKNLFYQKKPFHFARYSPVVFQAMNQKESSISVFQTISVKDFGSVFSSSSLDKLENEKGLIIAHTYFAFLGENHPGRLFKNNNGELNPDSKKSLLELGNRISSKQIWNPTANELAIFHKKLLKAKYQIEEGKLVPIGFPGEVRWIS